MQIAPRVGAEYWTARWYRFTGKKPIYESMKGFGERSMFTHRRNFDSARCKQIVGVE